MATPLRDAEAPAERPVQPLALQRAPRPRLVAAARMLLLTVAGLLSASPALAYIDPNAGGWLFQLLFPVLVAIGGAWAAFRTRLSVWWARLRGRRDPEGPDRDTPDA